MSFQNGKYSKLSRLGEGSFGKVYLVRDEKSESKEYLALKKIKTSASEGVSFTTLREIKILREIQHKNIISVFNDYLAERCIF